jgi:hypothetical protein
METLAQYKELLSKTLTEVESYEKKATKAASKRIRKLSNEVGKLGKFLRKELIEADKGSD